MAIKRILAIGSDSERSERAYALVTLPAAVEAGAIVERASAKVAPEHYPEAVLPLLPSYDLVVADVSNDDPSVAYLLGCAHALKRPVLLVAPAERNVPLRANNTFVREAWVFATPTTPETVRPRVEQLRNVLTWALTDPEAFLTVGTSQAGAKTVFVSYAHQDARYLSRLLKHLHPLERDGLVEVWADTKLAPGAAWRKELDRALGRARIALLLLSADFMASAFVQDHELPALLAAAETRGTRILPLIVGPCQYDRHPVLSSIQSLNDPARPLISLPEHEVEAALDEAAFAIDRILRGARSAA